MMRSMFSAVSGLRNHQIRMDVIGNNIANVNTVGFKSGRVNFQELFNQTLRGASATRDDRGGTNPQQIGLGMTVSSIDTLHTQGNLQVTGKMTDLAIEGNGFFILGRGSGHLYTRAGNFDKDALGYLVNPDNGLRLQGWMATDGVLPTSRDERNLQDIRIPVGSTVPAAATTSVVYGRNLSADVPNGTTYESPIKVFDSQGRLHTVVVTFTKTATNEWTWEAQWEGDPPNPPEGTGVITFNPDGSFASVTSDQITFNPVGVDPISVTVDFSRVTQFSGDTTISAIERDGYMSGTLEDFTIDANGVITGTYSNGLTRTIAQVALCSFVNPAGLLKLGQNLYQESNNSGMPEVGELGRGGRGTVAPSNLEMSNVDLAKEFTEMIVTQRGFQANSRVITTTDEMLQELVNLKR